ncbi:hypothetical protein GCM10009850_091190 [Nonomuraea monospora]|uniref:Uncharacterized protein n=1 Tax=Nonomuraea monospora TaxID=568818 RepID=A0ABP5PPT1_9ACTN
MRVLAVAVATMAGLALGAAPARAAEPEGAYWRVKEILTMDHGRPVGSGYRLVERRASVTWTTRDNRSWFGYRPLGAWPKTPQDEAAWKKDGSPDSWTYRTEGMKISLSTKPGKGWVKRQSARDSVFMLGERPITYQQLQGLPADAAGIRAFVGKRVDQFIDQAVEDARTDAPKATRNDWVAERDRYVAEYLVQLLYQSPVAERTRGAVYEALKTTKGVTDLGQAKDSLGRAGQKLSLPVTKDAARTQVIVDTKAMTLLAQHLELTGGKAGTRDTTYEAGWTNEKPAVPAAG